MKIKFEIEGDFDEEKDAIFSMLNFQDVECSISEAIKIIKERLRTGHYQISEEEEETLRTVLYHLGLC